MMVLRALGLFVIVVLAVTFFVIAVMLCLVDEAFRAIEEAVRRRGNRRR